MAITVQQIADRDATEKPAFNVTWHPALMAYAAQYTAAAQKTSHVTPCMLAAIANRETGGTNELQIGVPPGEGCGVGITQITAGVDWSNLADPCYPGYGSLMNPQINLEVCAAAFLEPLLQRFSGDHQSAFAAYNVGAGNVEEELAKGLSPDAWTTGANYGQSVFRDWINFVAASLGIDENEIEWSSWKPK